MVDTEVTSSLAALSRLDWRRHHQQRKPTRMDNKPNFSRRSAHTTVGWISRKNLASGRGGAFFLDIPSPETNSGLRRYCDLEAEFGGLFLK